MKVLNASIFLGLKKSLVDEFYRKLELEIVKYSACQDEEGEVSSSLQDDVTENEYDENIDRTIIQQLTEFNNPFLLKAFEEYLPPELLKRSNANPGDVTVENTKTDISNIFERYFYYTYYK